jgi:FkbM family methyltransferase
MIEKDSFPVYAQYNEDIILVTLLYEVKKGFYVDVGANQEEYHSVTKLFYERGWNGINIEPIPRLIKDFNKKRARDINLNIAVSDKKGQLMFREYPEHDGLSTFSKPLPENANLLHKDYEVVVDSLSNILDDNKVKKIDFLKIDVEGFEYEVLRSNNWAKYRPTVICVEANKRKSNWAKYITEQNYTWFIFDGLNEYYVANESINITKGFAERVAINSHNAIRNHHVKAWDVDIGRIKFLEDFTNKQDKLISSTQEELEKTQKELEESDKVSFKAKSYKRRILIAIKGLSVDYYRNRLNK